MISPIRIYYAHKLFKLPLFSPVQFHHASLSFPFLHQQRPLFPAFLCWTERPQPALIFVLPPALVQLTFLSPSTNCSLRTSELATDSVLPVSLPAVGGRQCHSDPEGSEAWGEPLPADPDAPKFFRHPGLSRHHCCCPPPHPILWHLPERGWDLM